MTLTVQNTKSDPPRRLRMMLYGPGGVGKTTFGGTMPRPFFIVPGTESGIDTLRGLDVDYMIVNTPDEMLAAARYFAQNYKSRGWLSVVVDPVTLFGRMITQFISDGGRIMIEKSMWGRVLYLILNVRDTLQVCDAHVLWIAHDDTEQSEDKMLRRMPKLVGAGRDEILQTMGLCAYLDVVEVGERKDGDKVIPAETIRRLWVRCPTPLPAGVAVPFYTKCRFEKAFVKVDENGRTIPVACYAPAFPTLAKYLAPRDEKGAEAGLQYILL